MKFFRKLMLIISILIFAIATYALITTSISTHGETYIYKYNDDEYSTSTCTIKFIDDENFTMTLTIQDAIMTNEESYEREYTIFKGILYEITTDEQGGKTYTESGKINPFTLTLYNSSSNDSDADMTFICYCTKNIIIVAVSAVLMIINFIMFVILLKKIRQQQSYEN
jgi:hypothetical protein